MPDDNDWGKYQKLVLHELERLNKLYEAANERLARIETEIAMLKVKSGAWGAVMGLVAAVGAILVKMLVAK